MRVLGTTAAVILALAVAGCGGEEESTTTGQSVPAGENPGPPSSGAVEQEDSAPEEDEQRDSGLPPEGTPDPPLGSPEASRTEVAEEVESAYLAYIDAINEQDGETLCALLPPNVERDLRPPVGGNDCAERLGKSIGYEDPRGYPVWSQTIFNGVESISVGDDPSTARLTARILTEFDDRGEPSVESDIAYLELAGGEWRLAQPSGALYRAIGRPELPPTVIAPPD